MNIHEIISVANEKSRTREIRSIAISRQVESKIILLAVGKMGK